MAGRYRIVSLIGQGGMGEVYRADDLKLGYSVALKFLPKEFAERPDWLAHFRSEVRLARQISHLNVCRVYDIGEADAALATFRASNYSPISTAFTAWYGPYSLAIFVIVLAAASYGFLTSLAGHRSRVVMQERSTKP